MATQVASLFATLDLDDRMTNGLKNAHSALNGLSKALAAVGVGGFFVKSIHEAMQAEEAYVDLKNAFEGYASSFAPATAAAGRWATVTKTSGEHVKEWNTALKSAQGTMERLSAKQAAGIALTGAEHAAYAKAAGAVQQYSAALAGATTTQKVWATGQQNLGKGLAFTFEEAEKLSKSLQKVTRFSDETIQRAEGMLATFHNLGRNVFPEATELALDMATKFKTDVQSAAIQLGKALQDPIQGVTALRRVGIQLSDAQEKQIRQFMKLGQIEKAQAVILGEVHSQVGNLARDMGQTAAGQFDILNNKISDLMESMGNMLLPAFRTFVGIAGQVIDALGPFAPVLVAIAGAMGVLTLASMPMVGALLAAAAPIAAIVAAVGGVALAFQSNFLGIRDTVMGIAEPIGAALNDIKTKIQGFLGAVFGGGTTDTDVNATVRTTRKEVRAGNVTQAQGDAAISGARVKAGQSFGDRLAGALGIDPKVLDQVKAMIEGPLKAIRDGIDGFIKAVSGADMSGVETVLKALALGLGALATGVTSAVMGTLEGLGKALPSFGAAIKDFLDMLSKAAKGDIEGALNQLGNGLAKLAEGAIKIPENIAEKIGGLLGIDWEAAKGGWKTALDSISVIADEVFKPGGKLDIALAPVKKLFNDIFGEGGPVQTAIAAVKTKFDETGKAVDTVVQEIQRILGEIGKTIKSIVQPILDAIGPVVELFAKWLGTLRDIPKAMADALGAGGGGASSGAQAGAAATGKNPGATIQTPKGFGFPTQDTGGPIDANKIFQSNVPELFLPSRSGLAVPLSKLRMNMGSSGGGGTIIYLTANGVDDPGMLIRKIDAELARRNKPRIGR